MLKSRTYQRRIGALKEVNGSLRKTERPSKSDGRNRVGTLFVMRSIPHMMADNGMVNVLKR